MTPVRPAILSGTWYPGKATQLSRNVREYISTADPTIRPAGRPILAVVPHAGYTYSGPTAGRLYGLLTGLTYDRIFILAPSHRARISRVALSGASAFAVPGGQVPVDHEVTQRLTTHSSYEVDDDAHAAEHAVEIQLPFLQEIFGGALRIVPMLVPSQTDIWLHEAAQALKPWCDGNSLFVISTDFTHYGAGYGYLPFSGPTAEKLAKLDQGAIDCILARDPSGLLAYGAKTSITMCGIQAAALALSAPLPHEGDAILVDYSRSGDRDGDYSLSVSYASLLLASPEQSLREAADQSKDQSESSERSSAEETTPRNENSDRLTGSEKQCLLHLARRSIEAAVLGKPLLDAETWAADAGHVISPRLQEKSGAFVTLKRGEQLRGCIGFIEGFKPLVEVIVENSVSAATRDTRFSPLQAEELAQLHLEISVLTPLRRVTEPSDIVLGEDGIVLQKGTAKAVFLPQVAVEQGWDLFTTLSHLSRKAGLGPEGWREGVQWEVFQAEVFGEGFATTEGAGEPS